MTRSVDRPSLEETVATPPSSLKTAKYSMSMSALSSVAGATEPALGLRRVASTSATSYEQYFSNIDEEDDDDGGGIFF